MEWRNSDGGNAGGGRTQCEGIWGEVSGRGGADDICLQVVFW
jgi:hypothetical protein